MTHHSDSRRAALAGARGARYLLRDVRHELDPDVFPAAFEPLGDAAWTDYDGEMPYGDFSVSLSAVITETRRYLGGLGLHAQQAVTAGPPGPLDTVYLHGDLVGSTVLLTDAAGMPVGSQAYTAFGEAVRLDAGPAQPRFGGRWKITAGDLDGDGTAEWSGTRYAYCGAWGYESGLLELAGTDAALPPIELVHVGARWYDPALGRFVQRDPIGLGGGRNAYLYVSAHPLSLIDPLGLYWDYDDITNPDGSITRHFYDRGWLGWKNDYQYSVKVPAGKQPPSPPRQMDQRLKAIGLKCATTAVSVAITGGRLGVSGGPEGIALGVLTGYLGGFVCGGVVGIVQELSLE